MTDLAPKPIVQGQLWKAAQCLAAGERAATAAAFAAIPLPELRRLAAEDADFAELLAAERERAAMPAEDWTRRMGILTRQAAERALADGKVSTVNMLLRATMALPAVAAGGRAARAAAMAGLVAEAAANDDEEEPAGAAAASPAPPRADSAAAAAITDPLPAVEADPSREARRRELLAAVVKPALRPGLAAARLELLEQYAAAADPDPIAYEAWFAAQPKPAPEPVPQSPEDLAAICRVTRHNPPWLQGEYLGYYRPPVPREAFGQDEAGRLATRAANDAGAAAVAGAPADRSGPQEDPLTALRARVARLLDRKAPRRADELDLAEAICALKWPNWPGYGGGIDLELLRRALASTDVDDAALHWLGSHDLARACREAPAVSPREPPGPG